MTASTLFSHLAQRGVRLGCESGSLTIRAPKGILTDADVRTIAEHKPELLALLTPEPEPTAREPDDTGRITVDVPSRDGMLSAVASSLMDPGPDPGDWPDSWWSNFDAMVSENVKLGYHPGVAAELAYEVLKSRASCPWRQEIADWPVSRREAWGRRAAELQDAGVDWRDAERRAVFPQS